MDIPVVERARPTGLWRSYVTEVAGDAEELAASHRLRVGRPKADRQMVVVLVVAALSLTIINFYAKRVGWVPGLAAGLGADPDSVAGLIGDSQLTRLGIWTAVQVGAYVAIPLIAIRVAFDQPIADFGLRVRGIGSHWPVYTIMLVAVTPLVVAASFAPSFQSKYPFYDLASGEALWPGMFAWWLLYAIQFVALEFFFRGFLVHGLKWRLGYAAIFVMVVPYNMIHFGKPLMEALGAIGGGLALGTLSLKTRSIWWGAALHIAVAGSMDLLSLYQRGLL